VRHGFTRFMRAHGQMAGPGERPRLAGTLAGTLAGLVSLPLLNASGATASLASGLGMRSWMVQVLYCVAAILAGMVYAGVFGRAANDRHGGWLFGIAYGFLLWMIGPVALLQVILERQFVTGTAAMGVLGANLISGLALGLLFRPMYTWVRRPLLARLPVR
jgi:hypothetical protein